MSLYIQKYLSSLEIQKNASIDEVFAIVKEEMAKINVDATQSKRYPELILFKYGIEARFNPTTMEGLIQRECRGLILDSSCNGPNNKRHWNAICFPYTKFFNAQEPNADILDLDSVKIYEKLDGSLVNMWYYNNKWNFSTSGSPDATGNVGDSDKTFQQLIQDVWDELKYEFPSQSYTMYTFMFELCSSFEEQRIVVVHNVNRLVLHGARHNLAYSELDPEQLNSLAGTGYETVSKFEYDDKENPVYHAMDLAEDLSGPSMEGFVLVDKNFKRVKVKGSLYVKLHRMKNKTRTIDLLEAITSNDYDEIICYFPGLKHSIEILKFKLEEFILYVSNSYNESIDYLEKLEPINSEKERKKTYVLYIVEKYDDIFHILIELYENSKKNPVKIREHILSMDSKRLLNNLDKLKETKEKILISEIALNNFLHESKPYAFIFDIDGTLAIMDDRGPFDFSKVATDRVNYPVKLILSFISSFNKSNQKGKIIFLSGRDDSCYDQTLEWIKSNIVIDESDEEITLLMRKTGDRRKDSIIKKEIYLDKIAPSFNVIAVFDDRDQVVDMWRKELKLTCFQVDYGNF